MEFPRRRMEYIPWRAWRRILALLMDTLSIEKAILVGHSMGGYISLAFIAEFPQRCIGMGLIASGASADLPEKRISRYQTIADLEVNGTNAIYATMPDSLTNSPEVKYKVIEMISMTPIPGLIGCIKGDGGATGSDEFIACYHCPNPDCCWR